ncbi:hypothetical protein [Actinomadura sp. 21ATH]|uniref:hypothetical protein n=1 Tax=Actinomadura sp. 21ATH TaxID=1735444 RepID=UPI0035BF2A80
MNVPQSGERVAWLEWLAGRLNVCGVPAAVMEVGGTGLLRVSGKSVRYVACVPVPQYGTWAYVFSGGSVLVHEARAVDVVARAMAR